MKRVLTATLELSMGCTTARVLPASELRKLDDYRAPEARRVRDAEGEPVVFSWNTVLVLETQEPPQPAPGKFLELHIDDTRLERTRANNARLRLDLADLQLAEARTFSAAKTTALLTLGVAELVYVYFAVSFRSCPALLRVIT